MSDKAEICANCDTENPIGGLHLRRRLIARKPDALLCELCKGSIAGQTFLDGGKVDQYTLTLLQGLNVIRKDVAAVLAKAEGK